MTKLPLALAIATVLSFSAPAFANDNMSLPSAPDTYGQGSPDEQGLSEDALARRGGRGPGWGGGRGPGWGRGGPGWGRGPGWGWGRGPGWGGRRCVIRDAWGRQYNNQQQCWRFSPNRNTCQRVCW